MDLQVLLIVKKGGSKYLLVEDHANKVLHFPTSSAANSQPQNDVKVTAQIILDEVLCISAKLKGVLKIIHSLPPPGSISSSLLSVVFVAEEMKSKSDLNAPKVPFRWLSKEEIVQFSDSVDKVALGLITHIEAGVSPHPLELVETLDANGIRRMSGTLERQMLEESNYGQNELDQVTDEFVHYCGSPSGLMTFGDFKILLKKHGMTESYAKNCFRAISSNGLGITLEELQIGLCALDPVTPHGAVPGQIRCQLIFKYYNNTGTGYLSFPEFKDMYMDIVVQRKISMSDKEFDRSLSENWDHFGIPPASSQGVSMNKFLTIVGQLKFRGTSVLFRLPQSPVKRGNDPYCFPQRPTCPSPIPVRIFNRPLSAELEDSHNKDEESCTEDMDVAEPNTKSADSSSGTNLPSTRQSNGRVSSSFKPIYPRDEENKATNDTLPFTIATHSVKVRRSGTLSDVHTLWDLVGTGAVSGSVEEILEHHKPSFDRLPSINAFDKTSKSNEMLSGLRYFEHALRDDGRGRSKGAFNWGAIDMTSVARCFLNICQQVINVCMSEQRLLEVKSPCYVLGDLHGNFHDLVCFEKVLWRMGPILTPASFLFLGDYVDRGEFGFEVISYLFAQKLLMPKKFLLIRGNHEIRAVQESFTYKTECIQKFGQVLGEDIWEATNKVFDAMPIAAVIDTKIFCVHGGIPHHEEGGGYIQAINNIPNNLPNPSDESSLAWDIMWNDPIRQEDEIEDKSLQDELVANGGFVDNDSRGTAHMFSAQALDDFLKRNDLSHVIRAHEVKEAGFQLQQNGRLLTVFSSSHYCGSSNEAACVLVDNRKIRTIRLDTRS